MVSGDVVFDDLRRVSLKRRFRVIPGGPLLFVSGLLWLPLFAVCLWLHLNDRFAPVFDMALFEMRVRDVGTLDSPLVGLGGRLSHWPEIGCHPGPLAFYVA